MKIRFFFGGWNECSKEEAMRFVMFLYRNLGYDNEEKKIEAINKHLLGARFTGKEIIEDDDLGNNRD